MCIALVLGSFGTCVCIALVLGSFGTCVCIALVNGSALTCVGFNIGPAAKRSLRSVQ